MHRSIALSVVALCLAVPPSKAAAQSNKVEILSVMPSGPVVPGQVTEFEVKAEVDLWSSFQAAVQVGFNDRSPTTFRTVETQPVHEGKHVMTFHVKAVATDWGDGRAFAVRVNVGPWTSEGIWRPYAEATKDVPLT